MQRSFAQKEPRANFILYKSNKKNNERNEQTKIKNLQWNDIIDISFI